ncbi:MAG: hypothetical protein APR63_09920 [Desulfuromonas sp. SDB]|nr:MAG: hypothetical protein APR63_09920 [Desulfuromonas sp. SDB]
MNINKNINFILIILIALLLLSPLFPLPELFSPYFSALANSMHFLIMAAATWIILGKSSSKIRLILSILIPGLAAIFVEFAQHLLPHRHFGIDDIIRGLMGSLTVILLVKFRKKCLSYVFVTLMILWSWGYDLVSTKVRIDLMQSRFPIIDDIGAPGYTNAWQAKEGAVLFQDDQQIILEVPPEKSWPQMESRIIPCFWNEYDSIILLVQADYKVKLGSRIQCSGGRYYCNFVIDNEITRLSVPLVNYCNGNKRFNNLWKIYALNFYVSQLPRKNQIIFYRIKLK